MLLDLGSRGDDVKFLEVLKNDEDRPTGAGGSSKTFPISQGSKRSLLVRDPSGVCFWSFCDDSFGAPVCVLS